MKRKDIKYVVVDVGAGLKHKYKDWLIQFPGLHIHAIEPHPDIAKTLGNLSLAFEQNDLTSGNRLHIHEFAATNIDGPCIFYLCSGKSSSSTLQMVTSNLRRWKYPLGRRLFKYVGKIQIKGKTLHTFFKEQSISGIAYLNIDVQGNAIEVLDGLQTQQDWNKIKELDVKVHNIDWELYQNQTVNYKALDMCRRHYFTMQGQVSKSRGQEDVLCFKSDVAVMKKWPSFGWSKRAHSPF